MGDPPNGWFIKEHLYIYKWMRTGGTPMTQETSININWYVSLFIIIVNFSCVDDTYQIICIDDGLAVYAWVWVEIKDPCNRRFLHLY